MILIWLIVLVGGLLAPQRSVAYPDFISYGYATCITCHYNGQGNGPLNDYGRALFTTEVASRAVFSNKSSEEQIAAKSGFLGSTRLPWWVRPGIKYRGLYFMTNPGSQAAVKKYITMQADLNVALQLDQKAKYVVVASGGYLPTQASRQGKKDPNDKNFISREHYLRVQLNKKVFTYVGLMDRAYGLRIEDHTAYSRAYTGLGMNDQAHGVMGQYYGDDWEITGHAFAGNLIQEKADVRKAGVSGMFEYDVAEKNRVGFGLLQSQNKYVQNTRFEIHSKLGLDKGNGLIAELGMIKDKAKDSTTAAGTGGYLMLRGIYLIERGYNVISQIEYFNATMSPSTPDMTRWTFGFLAFPMPRMEFRANFVTGRSIMDTALAKDSWMVQTQLHLSL